MALQVSVEVLVEDLRGRTVGVAGPAKDTVHQMKSKKAATKARKKAWQAWLVSAPADGPPYTQQEKDQLFEADEADFLTSDRDGDGSISLSKLRRAVKRLSLSAVGVEGKFREADADGDGFLGFGEYLAARLLWEPEEVFQDPATMYE